MGRYIVRRLLILPIVLIGLSFLIFGMVAFLDPATRSALYVTTPPKTARALQQLIITHGLDKPIWEQYWNWLSQVLHGDL